MPEKTTTVSVSKETWRELQELRLKLGVRSLEEVIIKLLRGEAKIERRRD